MVQWRPKTKKYYQNKGYLFTKYEDKFQVKVEDLQKGSSILVNVKCDNPNCKNPYLKPMQWNVYLKCTHENNIYFCQKCAVSLFGAKKMIKTRLKKSISFQQWCINNNREDILERWDYELNKLKPDEISYSSMGINKKGYWFKCPRGIHESELKLISSLVSGTSGAINCHKCNSIAQWCIDNIDNNFFKKYWDYEKNTINPWDIAHSSIISKIWIKCQEKDYHGSYLISCNNFIKGKRCPYCSNKKVHIFDSLGTLYPQSLDLWSNKNNKSPYEYAPHGKQEVWWKCENNKHKDYYRKISNSNIANFHCPKCVEEQDESFLQGKVRLYLETLNYTILHESKCTIVPQTPKCKGRRGQMPFDNEIKELKLIVEVHGCQHYRINTWDKLKAKKNHTTPEHELFMQKVRDRYKKYIAYTQGYNYIAIPYWTDNKKEEWKQLIINIINKIMKR